MKKKQDLHPRNIHNQAYDFEALKVHHPSLSIYVKMNKYDSLGIDYSNSYAVHQLNQAILSYNYKVKNWSIPKGHLCPPVPSRANYIHYIADLLAEDNDNEIPVGTKIKGLDIGTGTSCIYPILGNSIYGWKFVGSEINNDAINNIKQILNSNQLLKKNIKIRFQKSNKSIFNSIVKDDEKFHFTMCNPPFYSSRDEAKHATITKLNKLNKNREKKGHPLIDNKKTSNFGGIQSELWCEGGEVSFIKNMIEESVTVKKHCRWFTTLVSKKDHLLPFTQLLEKNECLDHRIIQMQQGNKISHLLAWRF